MKRGWEETSRRNSHLSILSQSESHFNPSYFVSFSPPSLFILSLLIVFPFPYLFHSNNFSLSPLPPFSINGHSLTAVHQPIKFLSTSARLLLPPLHSLFLSFLTLILVLFPSLSTSLSLSQSNLHPSSFTIK